MTTATTRSNFSTNFQKSFAIAFHKKLKALFTYKPSFERLDTPIHLFKPEERAVEDIEEDYNLSKYTGAHVQVQTFKGDHSTVLANPELRQAVVEVFDLKECVL